MNIKIVKLINGEIIVGNVVEENDKCIISDHLQIAMTEQGIGFVDFNNRLSEPGSLEVNMSNVLYYMTPRPDLLSGYTNIVQQQKAENAGIYIPNINDIANV